MNNATPSDGRSSAAPIVPIVLHQLARLRAEGSLTQARFDAQVERLLAEELRPRGQSLLLRELADGCTRFIVKDRAGKVCDLIDCVAEPRQSLAQNGPPRVQSRAAAA